MFSLTHEGSVTCLDMTAKYISVNILKMKKSTLHGKSYLWWFWCMIHIENREATETGVKYLNQMPKR